MLSLWPLAPNIIPGLPTSPPDSQQCPGPPAPSPAPSIALGPQHHSRPPPVLPTLQHCPNPAALPQPSSIALAPNLTPGPQHCPQHGDLVAPTPPSPVTTAPPWEDCSRAAVTTPPTPPILALRNVETWRHVSFLEALCHLLSLQQSLPQQEGAPRWIQPEQGAA